MSISRLHRLLRLVTLLQGGTSICADALAAELGISRRTLFRDLATLEAAGIPYFYEPNKGYRIAPGFFLPPVNLKVTEALGLMFLAKNASAFVNQPMMSPAVEAVRKLVAMLPSSIREVCQDLTAYVSVSPQGQALVQHDSRYYGLLQQAIDQRRVVRMVYDSLHEGDTIETLLHPYHLHFAVRAWYIIGRSKIHRETRVFKLSRIIDLELLDEQFRTRKPFDVDEFFGNAWSMIRDEKQYHIELEFASKVARNVSEVRWHKSQRHQILEDGRCIMHFDIDGLDEITWWLLGYGDQVIVRQPAELREHLCRVYRRALDRNCGG
jgi:predicted DNA-binding transcriptional regulator YafY